MKRFAPLFGLFTLLLAMSACSDISLLEPGPSAADEATVAFSMNGAVSPLGIEMPPRHLVVLKNAKPDKFQTAVEELGGRVFFVHAPTGVAGVEGLDDAGAAALAGVQGVALVEAEPMFPMAEPVLMGAPEMAVGVTSPSNPAGAYFYSYQWNMRAIHADEAWAAGRTGSSGVTVAILDTGIGYLNPDLAGRVDLARSVSFVPADDYYVNLVFPGAHPIADIGYHGTHVAATVASNGWLAAGVTSQVTLMGVKVCSVAQGGCPGVSLVQGILHAADYGADVANMSLGGGFLRKANPGYVSILNRVFNYAKQKNLTMVVSAGNDAFDLDRNPAPSFFKTYCDAAHVICVSATGPTASDQIFLGPWYNVDAPADYTNFGRSAIHVAAPGGTDFGYITAACSSFSLVIPVCQSGTFVVHLTGTSMAAPHVSGLAALAVEDVGKNPGRVAQYIARSADRFGGGNTPYYGKGRINVFRAVSGK